jgi:valyl-tRNA synthetase
VDRGTKNEEEAYEKAAKLLDCSQEMVELERDEDVLDTWFSSGLFPFSVFGWPDNTEDMEGILPYIVAGNWIGYSFLLGR